MPYLKRFVVFALLALSLVSARQSDPVWIYGGGTFSLEDDVTVEVGVPQGQEATLTLYRVANPEKILELGGPQYFAGTAELDLRKLQSKRVETKQDYFYDTTSFGKLPLGVYFAQLEGNSSKSATLILVTDLSLVVKSDRDNVLVYSAQNSSGEPRAADVFLLHEDEIYAQGQADAQGLSEFSTDISDSLVVAARFGNAWAFSDNYWNSWALQSAKVYVQTDRPIYRPGHTVYFKGTARSPAGLSPLVNEEVEVRVSDSDGSEIYTATLQTDAYGSFSADLSLGAEPPLGYYSIEARVKDDWFYASFSVEEFQKPEYRVTVTADEAVAVQGDEATFVINAEYLFGGSVAGAKVSYAVLQQPYYRWSYTSRYGFYEDYSYSYYYGGEMIDRGEGTLDAEGNLIITVPLPKDKQDYQLSVQAGVTDEARREISATGTVTAYRSDITLDVRTDRYAYKEGEDAQITVRAEDINGNPVIVPFSVATERYYWREGDGRQEVKGQVYRGETNAEGIATLTIPFAEQGSYNLIATAEDAAGRKTSASDYVWVSGNSRWYWAYDGLTITTDKEEYEVGDTARFVVQSPVADAYALVTREGQDLHSYELVKLDGSVLTYELPITSEMTPNGYLSVAIIGDGTTYYETAGFRVPPVDKFLNVEITSDNDTYKPGEVATFELRVSDASGTGVAAQVAVGIVDEGIYLVRADETPDIRGFFYALESNLVGTQLSDWYYFGSAQEFEDAVGSMMMRDMAAEAVAAPAPMDEAVFGQSKGELAPAELRSDFRDTILWLPTLTTDENGLATARVTFPDNLTEWRLTARAITLGDEVGQDSYNVSTTLPVIARLAAPRFFVRGDEASVRVIGQNNLVEAQDGRLELATELLTVEGLASSDSTLAAGGRSTADFTVTAPTTGMSTITATALTAAASDAMRLPIPVLPHGIRSELGWADSGDSSWTFTLPANADLNTTSGTLYLTPSLAAAVSPALSYLAGYPYGCTEQTMSRFYPSVLAAQAGDLARLPDDIADNLDDIVAKGIKRISDFQHDDGGWGFWQYDESSVFISAYVVNGLLDAQAAGYRVKAWVLEYGLDYLEQAVTAKDVSDYRIVDADAKAYAYNALARAGRDISGLGRVVGRRDMSPYGLALSVTALIEAGQEVEANLYLDELMSKIIERDQVAYWETGAPRYYWNDDRVEATAYALDALARLRPEDPIIAKVVNWLLLEREGARWVSTKDTAAVVKAALSLAEATGEAGINYRVTATLNGEELLNTRMQGQSATGLELPFTVAQTGESTLAISVEGQGTLYSSANIGYFSEQDEIPADNSHFEISRSYERLTPVFDELDDSYSYAREPLRGAATVGDYLLVTVTLDPHADYRYVMVNEPLPAGYRVIENDQAFRITGLESRYGYDYWGWNYWYDGRDVRDERVDYYFTHLGGEVSFTYILRAETPGTYSALPTQAWLMYEPDVRGNSKDATLEVVAED